MLYADLHLIPVRGRSHCPGMALSCHDEDSAPGMGGLGSNDPFVADRMKSTLTATILLTSRICGTGQGVRITRKRLKWCRDVFPVFGLGTAAHLIESHQILDRCRIMAGHGRKPYQRHRRG